MSKFKAIFRIFSPKIPAPALTPPPPPPPPPAPPPVITDVAPAAAGEEERKKAARRRGRRSTIRSQGLLTAPAETTGTLTRVLGS